MTGEREITAPLTSPLQGWTKPRKPREKADGRTSELMDYLRERVPMIDGSEVDNRRACWSLILKIRKANPDHDPVTSIKALIDAALSIEFHRQKLTSFRYLLNYGQRIVNDYRARSGDALQNALRKADEHFARKSGGG